MYASITKVIPSIDDPLKTSGCILCFLFLSLLFDLKILFNDVVKGFEALIEYTADMVNRDKKIIDKFEFNTGKRTDYETCNTIWEIINKQ